ncbi:hypothetical protein IPN35_02970 [Candidatus Peregrinibacteria bacterium]|nr:MAG: hypothetical protein IPN35_02970 [Candidatus Peregrinibacteria bacterium]
MKNIVTTISVLFRECEQIFGSRDFSFLAIESLRKAVVDYKGTRKEFCMETEKMVEIVKNTSPRIALLIMMFFRVFEEFEDFCRQNPNASLDEYEEKMVEIIDNVEEKRKKSVEKLLAFSHEVLKNRDRILLHDASHTIFDILLEVKRGGKKLEIVVAEQEAEKTANIIRFLAEHDFSFRVIPEYLLSYVRENVDCCFVGAVTVNSLGEVVGDAGTNSLVSQMRAWKIPVIVPLTTDKFSLWDAERKHHSYKVVKRESVNATEYDKLIYSHDRYPVEWVSKFITNKGVLTAEELQKMYDTYYEKSSSWRVLLKRGDS